MKRRAYRRQGPGALDLIEEAVHLLRLVPAAVLATYYLGALPFVLGGLYFWADMSRSPTAHQHCAPAALGLALLFLWMKAWQGVFTSRLQAHLTGRDPGSAGLGGWLHAARVQTILQPPKLFLLPAALVLLVPFGWAFAFYENVSVFAGRSGWDTRRVTRAALRQAQTWPSQNHLLLLIFGLFGFVVFLDIGIGLMMIPGLMKVLLGVETAFTRGGWSVLNTTFLALCSALAFLCLDPILKAIYVLRCFYGEAMQTGEDLRVDFLSPQPDASPEVPRTDVAKAPFRRTSGALLLIATLWLLAVPGPRAVAAAPPIHTPARVSVPETPSAVVTPGELDQAIDEVLARREYLWRSPREWAPETEAKEGMFTSFMNGLVNTLRGSVRTVAKWARTALDKLGDFIDWIQRKLGGRRLADSRDGTGGFGWMASWHILLWTLVAVVASTAALFAWRTWGRRRPRVEVVSEALTAAPDLADENVTAAELPEDAWLKLARELMSQGDLRLGLRALYLGSLAHLARRELISIARFKSNRDYERELGRRARSNPQLAAVFAENVTTFDRVWYGLHEVTAEVVQQFESNLEQLRAC